ncbi:nuclear transport factor 2 family protein [Silvimonas soli]|uniref:nuclear transport factor 2 family protein n=1 Tax=Silvimonas soli TaxID=2980100 RepID=UPI0024B348FD|nr:nuclear transport factor 2 family protein [Silvimonas soli]
MPNPAQSPGNSNADLAAHLLAREGLLHAQAVRADAQALDQLLADDYFELGVAGTVWTKPAVISALAGEAFSTRQISDFKLNLLADSVALVTYHAHRVATAQRPAADSLRSSIWRLTRDRWQMVFHQGTPLP